MNDVIRRLPDAEQEVMQAIWACTAPVARTDIEEILFKTHPMAMTTLLTLLWFRAVRHSDLLVPHSIVPFLTCLHTP